MIEDLKEEILETYESLVDNGVVFYYGSETIETGEITNFNITIDNDFENDNKINVEIELNDFETYEITIDDFIEYHSKEGVNYHTWPDVRKLDKNLSELLIMDN